MDNEVGNHTVKGQPVKVSIARLPCEARDIGWRLIRMKLDLDDVTTLDLHSNPCLLKVDEIFDSGKRSQGQRSWRRRDGRAGPGEQNLGCLRRNSRVKILNVGKDAVGILRIAKFSDSS